MTIVDTPRADIPRAGRRQWVGLAVLALPCLLYAMDLTVLNLAVPHLTADLRPSSAQLLWIVDIYGFLVAGSLITMGTLGDRIGRRKLLLAGAAGFGVASVLAASATSAELLIAARALLGVAGATLAPSTLSLLRNMFPDPRQRPGRDRRVGRQLLGRWRDRAAGRRGAAGALLVGVGVPGGGAADGAAAGAGAAAAARVPRPRRGQAGPGQRGPVAGGGAGGDLGAQAGRPGRSGLAARAGRPGRPGGRGGVHPPAADPGGPADRLRLFQNPAFSTSVATNTLGIFVMFGTFPFIAQYLQLVVGLSPLAAGLWLLPSGGAAILGSILVPVVLRRVRPVFAMVGGLAFMAVGLGLLTRVDGAGLAMVVAASVALPLASGLVFLPATGLVVGAAPPQRAGAAAAISQTGWEFGGALGIAVLGSIGIALYRREMADAVPAGVAPEAAAAARDTLGGAAGVAVRLPGDLGAALLDAAREAFTQGLHVAAALSVAVTIGLAIVVASLLREPAAATTDARPQPEPDPAAGARGGQLEGVDR
jgi:DHA2 family multidrug resistance protein-like MFS transporter